MSMIGEYARVTPAELDRVVRDPDWGESLVFDLMEAEDEAGSEAEPDGLGAARFLDTDKAWDTLGYLLRRVDFPVNVVHGEEPIPGAEDWGYGPPRYLTVEQVRTAARELAATDFGRLVRGVTPADLVRAEVYPWSAGEDGEWFDFVQGRYGALVSFFQSAAREGDALLVWLG
ncbi:YfbM family protein [Streptomyces sp. MAR4 CNX-425]|uniref:YfbM family protein n=1 Tax=Streptomyces sp. MAR4 CNX-425 TaxID=3406343 RepID=UPI003B50F9E4